MLASTSIYWAIMLRNTYSIAGIGTLVAETLVNSTAWVEECLENGGNWCNNVPKNLALSGIERLAYHDIPVEYCAGTAALTVNIVIGDAIVLGRVYVIWPRSRLLHLLLGLLLLGTIATAVVSTAHSCRLSGEAPSLLAPALDGPAVGSLLGSFFEGDPFGLAASVLSLATNVISTCLIACQAWKHCALIRGNGLRSYLGRSQVSRAFTLLVESGAFYSVIWIFVVVYQCLASASYVDSDARFGIPHSSAFRDFTTGWQGFTQGALVTVIAIYSTVIMLLVALNRSECDAIASHRDNGPGQDVSAAVPSLVFRGSVLRQLVSFAQAGNLNGPSRALASTPVTPSFADNELENCTYGPVDILEP